MSRNHNPWVVGSSPTLGTILITVASQSVGDAAVMLLAKRTICGETAPAIILAAWSCWNRRWRWLHLPLAEEAARAKGSFLQAHLFHLEKLSLQSILALTERHFTT